MKENKLEEEELASKFCELVDASTSNRASILAAITCVAVGTIGAVVFFSMSDHYIAKCNRLKRELGSIEKRIGERK